MKNCFFESKTIGTVISKQLLYQMKKQMKKTLHYFVCQKLIIFFFSKAQIRSCFSPFI